MESPVEILIVEDDQGIGYFLQTALRHEPQYQAQHTGTLRDAWREMEKRRLHGGDPFAVILLDLGLPDGNGQDFITRVRARYADGPLIIVLSARNNEADKIQALDAGADDYLAKPFTIGELLARLRAHLRRRGSTEPAERIWRVGGLEIDDSAHTVKKMAMRWPSPPPSTGFYVSLPSIGAASSPIAGFFPPSGEPTTASRPTMCVSISSDYGKNSRTTPPRRNISAPSRAPVTACAAGGWILDIHDNV